MKKLTTFALALLFGAGLLGAGSLRAEAAKDTAGIMTISDRGNALTEAGIAKAASTFLASAKRPAALRQADVSSSNQVGIWFLPMQPHSFEKKHDNASSTVP